MYIYIYLNLVLRKPWFSLCKINLQHHLLSKDFIAGQVKAVFNIWEIQFLNYANLTMMLTIFGCLFSCY